MRSILVLVLSSALFAGGARAETSSWASQGDGAAGAGKKAAAPAKGAKPGAGKAASPAPASPAAPASGAAPPVGAAPPTGAAPASDGVSSHAKGAPQGENAAYEAFDQGRYLTALE